MNILIFSGLSDKKLLSKISPLVSLEKIKEVYLIRNSRLQYDKVKSLSPPLLLDVLFLREFIKFIYGFYVCLFKEIDYVIGIYLRPHGIFAWWIGRIFKKNVIQLLIGNDVDLIEKHPRIFKKLLSKAKNIGVRGNCSKIRISNIIKQENKFFIPNNIYSPPKEYRELCNGNKEISVICIADFTRVKRIDIFLNVILKVKKKYPEIKAVILGGDKRRSLYDKRKHKMGLDTNVTFTGIVKDVYSYLGKSKLFLMTSEAEGLPMAVIEAMSMGLPCIVPDVGDISEVARDGYNAFVVKPLDIGGFATKVIQLLEDNELYEKMSGNALNTIKKKEEEFSLEYNKRIWGNILGW